MEFTNNQIERYSRQIILKKIGVNGQKKLLRSSVLVVGAGGLGSPTAIYLAAMGIGKIGIIDKDTDWSILRPSDFSIEINGKKKYIKFNEDFSLGTEEIQIQ